MCVPACVPHGGLAGGLRPGKQAGCRGVAPARQRGEAGGPQGAVSWWQRCPFLGGLSHWGARVLRPAAVGHRSPCSSRRVFLQHPSSQHPRGVAEWSQGTETQEPVTVVAETSGEAWHWLSTRSKPRLQHKGNGSVGSTRSVHGVGIGCGYGAGVHYHRSLPLLWGSAETRPR